MSSSEWTGTDHVADRGHASGHPTTAVERRTHTSRGLLGLVRRQPLGVFFALAFAISWLPYPFYVLGVLPRPLFLPLDPWWPP